VGNAPNALESRIFQRVRASGGRVTAPKRAVVAALAASDRHLTAEDLAERAADALPGIAPSTVYRVLANLEDAGVVEHVHNGREPAFYHLRDRGHAHLVCNRCGAIIDIPDDLFTGLRATIRRRYGFTIEPHHAALLGRCAACRETH
jgi:Fe2+ or Zn2+ uptake regulation protein